MSANFSLYKNNFPQQYVNNTAVAYLFLNTSKLKTELELIYRLTQFRNITGIVNLL